MHACGTYSMPSGKTRMCAAMRFLNTCSESISPFTQFKVCLLLLLSCPRSLTCYIIIKADCGDYVVVINSKEIALKNQLWRTQRFFRHTRYPQGARYTKAWEEHEKDPTKVGSSPNRFSDQYWHLMSSPFVLRS